MRLDTKEGAVSFRDRMLRQVKANMEKDGYLTPCVILLEKQANGNIKMNAVDLSRTNAMEKGQVALVIKEMAKRLHAFGSILVAEGSMLELDCATLTNQEVQARLEKVDREGVMSDPSHKMIAAVYVEHKELGQEIWEATLTKEDGKTIVGEFQQVQAEIMITRWSNLLPGVDN